MTEEEKDANMELAVEALARLDKNAAYPSGSAYDIAQRIKHEKSYQEVALRRKDAHAIAHSMERLAMLEGRLADAVSDATPWWKKAFGL